jgi:hypothetical protein
MYGKIMAVILLFPWSILGIMVIGALRQRQRRAAARSR